MSPDGASIVVWKDIQGMLAVFDNRSHTYGHF